MSVPRGFYETNDNCDDSSPAFVRGVLVDQATWKSKGINLLQFPRWILYGGPFQTRQIARTWDDYLFFYSTQNGSVWFPADSPLCVVPGYRLKWPADSSVQWTWVYETKTPSAVSRVWDASLNPPYKYVWA